VEISQGFVNPNERSAASARSKTRLQEESADVQGGDGKEDSSVKTQRHGAREILFWHCAPALMSHRTDA
jgi:hypothetical protein